MEKVEKEIEKFSGNEKKRMKCGNLNPLIHQQVYDNKRFLQSKEIANVYADKFANELVKVTLPKLGEISGDTKEAIIRYLL